MRGAFLATCACWAALQLGACGKGLYTSDPDVLHPDGDDAVDSRGVVLDAGADRGGVADRGADNRSGVDDRVGVDNRVGIDIGADADVGAFTSVLFKSGEGGPVDLQGEARVTVRSGTFSEDVTITVRAIPAPRTGPVGAVYQVEQTPSGVHARMPLHFDLFLTTDQEASAAQYKLAIYKPKNSLPGLWVAIASQTISPTDHTVGADINNLDSENVVVALLRKCETVNDCGAFAACTSGLCQ